MMRSISVQRKVVIPRAATEERTHVLRYRDAAGHRCRVNRFSFEGMSLAEVERMAIEAALERNAGNVTHAARDLDVNPSTIYRKLDRWKTVKIGSDATGLSTAAWRLHPRQRWS